MVIGSISPVSNVMITEVEPGSPADNVGLTELTLITHINDKQIKNASAFYSYIDSLDPNESFMMRIKKDETIRSAGFANYLKIHFYFGFRA